MMRRRLFGFFVFVIFISPALAQHQPLMSQYMLNKFLFNPALGGLKDQTVVNTAYRKQWAGIEGAPESYYISAHTALGGDNPNQHQGIGGNFFSDQIGPLKTTTTSLSGSYHTLITDGFNLSAGLSLGLMQRYMDVNTFDPASNNDPVLNQSFNNSLQPYLGIGIWAFTDRFYTGFSSIQAPSQEIQTGLSFASTDIRHYFFNAGAIVPLWREKRLRKTENHLLMIPSLLVRYMPSAPLVVDINARFVYQDFLMAGFSYRSTHDMVVQIGAEWQNKLQAKRQEVYPTYFFAYSYDVGGSAIGFEYANTHEITLGIRLNRNRIACPLIERSPQYFF